VVKIPSTRRKGTGHVLTQTPLSLVESAATAPASPRKLLHPDWRYGTEFRPSIGSSIPAASKFYASPVSPLTAPNRYRRPLRRTARRSAPAPASGRIRPCFGIGANQFRQELVGMRKIVIAHLKHFSGLQKF
jgi:hypothetical protein